MRTTDLKLSKTPSILVIGDGGTGKTRFAASCPTPFIYDFDAGMASVRDFDIEYETFKDAPWRARGKAAVNKDLGIYPWGESWPRLVNHLNDIMWEGLEAGTLPYQTVVLDSLTTLANQSMNYTLRGTAKTGEANPEVQHWGTQLRLLEFLMEQIAAWPVLLVVTAHIKRDDNLVTGTREYLPLVAGQLSGKIGIYFDEVYYTQVTGSGDKRKFTLKTTGGGLYSMAKSRYNVPDGTEATWSAIEPYILGTNTTKKK